ncbi:MAG TPA: hypothetical protein VKA27_00390 [Sunxiuqinia sp.]|nr:hypothetical protein [Sunxiuqinia sp.]
MNKGISRKSRKDQALNADYVSVDERSLLDMVQFSLDFSRFINYYGAQNKVTGRWNSLLLNDPAFISAMIAGTELERFKLNDDIDVQLDQGRDLARLNELTNELIRIVKRWSTLFSLSNYKGTLQKEIDKLLLSVAERNINEDDDESLESAREFYDHILGNVVYIKGKASKSFEEQLLNSNHQPHIGLLLAFLKLYQNVQRDMNSITKKHLDYYYLDLLQQKRKKLKPITAIVRLQLQKGAGNFTVNGGDRFEFVFEDKQQLVFEAISSTTVSKAEIADVKTLYKSDFYPFNNKFEEDGFSISVLYEADILPGAKNAVHSEAGEKELFPATLGEEKTHFMSSPNEITLSDVGLLITSPALILEKGRQEISLTFKITPKSYHDSKAAFEGLVKQEAQQEKNSSQDLEKLRQRIVSEFFNESFLIYISTGDGWKMADYSRSRINRSDSSLSFDIQLNPQTEALIPFDPEIHGGNYDTEWPCIKILLNNDAQYHPYKILKSIVIEDITIDTSVSEVSNLTLSNPSGNLDSSIPFMPFGPAPVIGGYLRIRNPLILQKNLSKLKLYINWSGLPQIRNGFSDYYKDYPGEISNSSFKAVIAQSRNIPKSRKQDQQTFGLFDSNGEFLANEKKINVNIDHFSFNGRKIQSGNSVEENSNQLFIVLTDPENAFGHPVFTEIYGNAALKGSRFRKKAISLPNQPYTPVIERLEASYSNTAREIMLRKIDDKGTDIKFVHIYPFGHVQVFPGPVKSQSFLLPQIEHKGNLFIGLKQVKPGDIVSIGFDLVPAVYIHTAINVPNVTWEYLSNNDWFALNSLLLEDSTDGLIKSGIIKIKIPESIQLENTYLPSDKLWIRAVCNGTEELNSRIKHIFTQAISITSNSQLSSPTHDLNNGNKIQKISLQGKKETGQIFGPYALEMNDTVENDDSFYSRVSEQLRHKNRIVSNWDVERIVLNRFSQIEKVRAYGRNSFLDELVKGSSLQVVVIPKNKLVDGTRGRSTNVNFSTLKEIKNYVSQFVSPYVNVEVSNPVYEQLKVRCKVKFNETQRSGYLISALNSELISYLSPDIENESIEKGFDESISKTEILNFIESRPYVEFVTEFSVLQIIEVQGRYKIIDTAKIQRIEDLRTISAYAILTSAPEHQIEILLDETPEKPTISGIGDLGIESDFVISGTDGKYT